MSHYVDIRPLCSRHRHLGLLWLLVLIVSKIMIIPVMQTKHELPSSYWQ